MLSMPDPIPAAADKGSAELAGPRFLCALAGVFICALTALAILQASAQSVNGSTNTPAPQTVLGTIHGALRMPGAPAAAAAESKALSWSILKDDGTPLKASAVATDGDDLFFLDPVYVWIVPHGYPLLSKPQPLAALPAGPFRTNVEHIPVQELSNFIYSPLRKSLEILDKSGDVFEFTCKTKAWRVLRPNYPTTGSPDPEYIDFTSDGKNVCLLDPERNQIWRCPEAQSRYFKEVLPWRLRPGDVSVANGISIAYDGDTYVVRQDGSLSKFAAPAAGGLAAQMPIRFQKLPNMRPTRLLTAVGAPLFIVERENNRVIAVNKQDGKSRVFNFPAGSDLRGMLVATDGFYIINGNHLEKRLLSETNADAKVAAASKARTIDARLGDLTMPLKGGNLPRHPGVWPGARRLYRYGVHKGTDFFNDPGNGTKVSMDTPVFAAGSGKVTRSDTDFVDMDAATYNAVIDSCRRAHVCSENNENKLRGCQVWIDHGNGLITKYAHLDRVKPGLKSGMHVQKGDLIGFVGVSGTGENLPGRAKYPHLHFEVWLDGNYLGWGLTPAETIGLYQDVFGNVSRGVHEQQKQMQ
jgi:murein DD-endopeptidase MepM/ murein hydrolase activator NlpD